MNIMLTNEQKAWIAARVAAGEFASEEVAAQALIALGMECLNDQGLDPDDANDIPLIKASLDAARAQVARGEFVTLDDHDANMSAKLAARKR